MKAKTIFPLLMACGLLAACSTPTSNMTKMDETTMMSDDKKMDETSMMSDDKKMDETSMMSDDKKMDETSMMSDDKKMDETTMMSDDKKMDETSMMSDDKKMDETTMMSDDKKMDETSMMSDDKKMDETTMMSDDKKMDETSMMSDDEKMEEASMMNEGKPAPEFKLKDINGKTHQLSDFKGKKVYLKFWASWCSVCLSSLGDSDELAGEVEGKDYVILTVVSPGQMGEKSEEDFKKWFKGLDYQNLPVLLDSTGQLLKEYGVRAYPTAAFIGSDGVLVEVHPGFMDKMGIEDKLKEIK